MKTPKPPITLVVDPDETDHFIVRFDRPGRVEITLQRERPGKRAILMAYVYEGSADQPDQGPLGAYDGSLDDNFTWTA